MRVKGGVGGGNCRDGVRLGSAMGKTVGSPPHPHPNSTLCSPTPMPNIFSMSFEWRTSLADASKDPHKGEAKSKVLFLVDWGRKRTEFGKIVVLMGCQVTIKSNTSSPCTNYRA
jgi:hypothetical protein